MKTLKKIVYQVKLLRQIAKNSKQVEILLKRYLHICFINYFRCWFIYIWVLIEILFLAPSLPIIILLRYLLCGDEIWYCWDNLFATKIVFALMQLLFSLLKIYYFLCKISFNFFLYKRVRVLPSPLTIFFKFLPEGLTSPMV